MAGVSRNLAAYNWHPFVLALSSSNSSGHAGMLLDLFERMIFSFDCCVFLIHRVRNAARMVEHHMQHKLDGASIIAAEFVDLCQSEGDVEKLGACAAIFVVQRDEHGRKDGFRFIVFL